MNQSSMSRQFNTAAAETQKSFTAAASLAIIGIKLREKKIVEILEQYVHIPQKTVKHRPIDKLIDALIAILAGAHGLVEINTRLRGDKALQAAFGREECAEQSVVQQTLDACGEEQVKRLQEAWREILRAHSQVAHHDFTQGFLIVDVDMTGMPCGPKSEYATRGYFAHERNRRGRQLGRVFVAETQEIVTDMLFAGSEQLNVGLQPLVEQAEKILDLDEERRKLTIMRIDAGGGTQINFRWFFEKGYYFIGKVYSGKYAKKVAKKVKTWYADPQNTEREYGFVEEPLEEYPASCTCIAVRYRRRNGSWKVGLLVSTISVEQILTIMKRPMSEQSSPPDLIAAYLHFYDQRGGGIESSFSGDKSGLGFLKRSKKRFAAQEMVMLLNMIAHNIVTWVRHWLLDAQEEEQPSFVSPIHRYGTLRMVRDIFHISGCVKFDQPLCTEDPSNEYPVYQQKVGAYAPTLLHRKRSTRGHAESHIAPQIVQIVLNEHNRLAVVLLQPFQRLLASCNIVVTLGET
jgi:Transposase DDE domain group 1